MNNIKYYILSVTISLFTMALLVLTMPLWVIFMHPSNIKLEKNW